nr:hypothetical protein [uncultured Enterobacter sp.]
MRLLRTACLLPILLLIACTFTGRYNSDAHRQLVMLEALHVQFIDDASLPDAQSDPATISQDDREMRLQFEEAVLFAQSLGDPLRLKNLTAAHQIYQLQYARFAQQGRPFKPEQAQLFRQQATQGWQQVIHGECLRPHSVCP